MAPFGKKKKKRKKKIPLPLNLLPTIRFVQEKPFFCIARCLFAYFVSL